MTKHQAMTTVATVRGAGSSIPTVPWRTILRLALIGTITMVLIVIFDMGGPGANPVALIQPGADGPSVGIIRQDFPDLELPDGLGLDGQQFYAIARDPFDLRAASAQLDRPAYRLQRPLYAWLAWLLHPTGGGRGLVLAFAAIGIVGLAGGGVAAGALSTALGGKAWPALAFPLLPGAYMSLRVSVADALAAALAFAALACAVRKRTWPAVVFAVLAVLTKEASLVVFAGWALTNRTRRDAALPVAGAVVAGAWALWLRLVLPATPSDKVNEIVKPFTAFPPAVRYWLSGNSALGMAATTSAVILAVVALNRYGLRHRLAGVLIANLAFVSVLNWNVIGLDFGGTRSTMPLLIAALICLAAPAVRLDQRREDSPQQGAAGIVGPSTASGALSNR